MGKAKVFGISVGVFVGFVVFIFLVGGIALGYKAFFAPKEANIDRTVYEQTQSYVHGKIQDLAKYKLEYEKKDDPIEKQAIQTLINQQFSQFDSGKVQDSNLRQFLIKMRGF